MSAREILYVSPFGDLWEVKEQVNFAARVFASKDAALLYARERAAELAPSHIILIGKDGREILRESLAAM